MKSNDSLKAELRNCTPSSIHLHAAHLSLHPSLCNTINVIRTKISHVFGQFSEIWADRKNCAGGILVVLIPNLDLNFWNSDPKIQYLGKFGPKNYKLSALLKDWHTCIWRMLILIATLVFRIATLNPFLGKFGSKNSKLSVFPKNWHIWYLEDADCYFDISFPNFNT